MNDGDDRIRAALHDLTAPRGPDEMGDLLLARVHEHARPRSRRVLPLAGLAAVVTLVIVIATTGAILIGRATPSAGPSESSPISSSPVGSASVAPTESGDPHSGALPEVHWTRQPVEVGAGTMGSVTRTESGLVAGGRLLDTGHHHNDADSEGHHLEAVVWTSPDGRSWHRVDSQPGFEHAVITSVEYSAAMLLAAGNEAGAAHSPRIWRSNNGADWSLLSPEGLPEHATLGSLTSVADGFLLEVSMSALGGAPNGSLWRSTDGVAWHEVVVGDYAAVSGWSVFATGGGYVAVGQRPADAVRGAPFLMRSADGVIWATVSADEGFGPDLVGIDDIVDGGPGFIATGRVIDTLTPPDPTETRLGPRTDGAIWTSPDLAMWTRVEPGRELFGGVEDESVRRVEPMAGGYVALGGSDHHAAVWVSADGIAWHTASAASLEALGATLVEDAVLLDGEIVVVGGTDDGQPAAWLGRATEPNY